MSRPKVDTDILSILEDYNLFIEGDKSLEMPFNVDQVDNNHISSMKGVSDLQSAYPLGNTVLECEVKLRNNYNYSFRILTDRVHSRVLFRMDEGQGTHRNSHLPIPIDEQQVPCPHFHKYGNDGIMMAYRTESLESKLSPLVISDGFSSFCEECKIKEDNIAIIVQEKGCLPLSSDTDEDPLNSIVFP